MKTRTGYVYKEGKRWIARITHTDEAGRRRNIKRHCATATAARIALRQLVRRVEERGEKAVEGDRLTFRAVAEQYAQAKLIEPIYIGEKKVAGLRSLRTPRTYIRTLIEHFGSKRLSRITHHDIEQFKLMRLKTPTKSKKQRSIAAVNRELELLRAVCNFAKRQGWIDRSPLETGESLIDRSAENSRERVLRFDEEARLLAACVGHLAHLRPVVVTALDTGFRRGEIFKLEWRDVDFAGGVIRLRAITTKSNRPREVAMTARVRTELMALRTPAGDDPTASVFGPRGINHDFPAACRAAGVEGLRFHDLRHTFVSRIIAAGIPAAEAMKLSGHATLHMLSRYLNPNAETAQRAAEALENHLLAQTVSESALIN